MAEIDHTNFSTLLQQSTQPVGSGPDGNVYFNLSTEEMQLIGVDELATVDFGAGAVTNPLNNTDGITARGLYNFVKQERGSDETLRLYPISMRGEYVAAGAYSFVNTNKLRAADLAKIRGSGLLEYQLDGTLDRVFHGVNSLGTVQSAAQPYYSLLATYDEAGAQAGTWTDFGRTGAVREVIQTYGEAALENFDYRARELVTRIRQWGYTPVEYTAIGDLALPSLAGFSAGYSHAQSLNAQNAYTLADVYGGAQISPWTGMTLEELGTPQVETGFNEADGSFTWVLHNSAGGTLQECAAYLDALILQDADIDAGAGSYNGKKGRVWYDYDGSGNVVTRSIGGKGLFIEGLTGADKEALIFTDDAAATKTYPAQYSVTVTGLQAGSRLQIYDTTNTNQLYNDIVAGTSYSLPGDYVGDFAVRLRIAYVSGASAAKQFVDVNIGTVTAAASNISYLAAQVNDDVYINNAIDGSAVANVVIVDSTFLVEVDVGSISLQSLYAYHCYWLFTAAGIIEEGSFIDAADTANYTFNSFNIKNVTAGPSIPLVITGGYAVDGSTGNAIDIIDTTGGTIFLAPDHVVPYNTGAAATQAIVQAGLDAQGYSSTRAGEITTIRKRTGNKRMLNKTTGLETLYDDDAATPLETRTVYNDKDGVTPYDGTEAPHLTDEYA